MCVMYVMMCLYACVFVCCCLSVAESVLFVALCGHTNKAVSRRAAVLLDMLAPVGGACVRPKVQNLDKPN